MSPASPASLASSLSVAGISLSGAARAGSDGAGGGAHGLAVSPSQKLIVIAVCALTALVSHLALAVFNDGVRPFMLDFIQGRSTRGATTAVSFGLSAGFVFGLGAPMALASGVLNPWLLFLPTDVLGILAPRRWLAPLLGAGWAALVVFGLNGVNGFVHELPVDFLTAMKQMSTPILFLFTLFPALAVTRQFGALRGAAVGIVELALVVATMKLWPTTFPGALAMAAGVLMLIGFATVRDLRQRRTERTAGVTAPSADRPGGAEDQARSAQAPSPGAEPSDGRMESLFDVSAARLRSRLPLFMLLGAGVCVLAQTHVFAGGAATSFLMARGDYTGAAQVDFYDVFGFIPLISTTALASGAYAVAGFTFVYPVGYLLPSPWLALPAGALVLAAEVLSLSWLGKVLGRLPSVRDCSGHLRGAIGESLQLAILFGSLMAADAMGGGLGILVVGGLYLLNEATGRVVVRLAAAPAAVLAGGVLLDVLYWLHLFTPVKS